METPQCFGKILLLKTWYFHRKSKIVNLVASHWLKFPSLWKKYQKQETKNVISTKWKWNHQLKKDKCYHTNLFNFLSTSFIFTPFCYYQKSIRDVDSRVHGRRKHSKIFLKSIFSNPAQKFHTTFSYKFINCSLQCLSYKAFEKPKLFLI